MIEESIPQWFGHVERMENDKIAKRVYVGKCTDSHSVGRPQKRWIDIVKELFKKRGLDVRQARRMLHDMILDGECVGRSPGDENLTLTRCHIGI